MKKKYLIVKAETTEELEFKVNKLLNEDYFVYGNVFDSFGIPTYKGKTLLGGRHSFSQTLILNTRAKDDPILKELGRAMSKIAGV